MSHPFSPAFTPHPAEASLPPLRTPAPPNPTTTTPVGQSPESDQPHPYIHPDFGVNATAVNYHTTTNTNVHGRGQEQGQGKGTTTSFSVLRTQAGGSGFDDWEGEYERQTNRAWEEKVKADLEGWRGGHGQVSILLVLESNHERWRG